MTTNHMKNKDASNKENRFDDQVGHFITLERITTLRLFNQSVGFISISPSVHSSVVLLMLLAVVLVVLAVV